MIFDRVMLAYMDEQGEMGLLEPISILFLSKQEIMLAFGGHLCILHGMKRAVLCRRCPEKVGRHGNDG